MQKLSDIKKNFPEWYQDIVEASGLAEHSPTPGCIVIKPYGYALWENIQQIMNKKIKEVGAQNAYFPLLIPESFFKKEAKHVEGFSPELAVVTYGGGSKLEEPLVVRPTSETIIYYMFAKWIKSWRDLPLKINQWANVVRWEMRARPFLRTREFLWQEGHTAHESFDEANKFALQMQEIYRDFAEEYLAIPTVTGEKSASERFAGGDHTYTFEAMMQDGKALQMGTAHVLAKNFSKAFEILFQDRNGELQSPQCTSWGITTRLIGALVMVHGDQNGLIIPPRIAAIAIIIIPIFRTEEEKNSVMEKVFVIRKELLEKGLSVEIDIDDTKTPGAKFFHWEMKGIPLRMEIGPKDLEKQQAVLVSRVNKKKEFVLFNNLVDRAEELLKSIQAQLLQRAKDNMKAMWYNEDKLSSFGSVLEANNGFYQTGWCGSEECELKLKEFKATVRCLLKENKHVTCFNCNLASKNDIVVAKAY